MLATLRRSIPAALWSWPFMLRRIATYQRDLRADEYLAIFADGAMEGIPDDWILYGDGFMHALDDSAPIVALFAPSESRFALPIAALQMLIEAWILYPAASALRWARRQVGRGQRRWARRETR